MRFALLSIIITTRCIFAAELTNVQDAILQNDDSNSRIQQNDSATTIEHSTKWYFAYSREYDNEDFQVKLIDTSFDTRVANILYTRSKLHVLSVDYHQFEFDNDQSVRREYESYISGPEVDQKLCTEHLIQMNELLDELEQISSHKRAPSSVQSNSSRLDYNERHVLMAQVLDSFGRYESGVLIGRADLIGSSEQCLGTKLKLGPESDQQVVGTRYCKASLRFDADLDPRIEEKSRARIQVGVCLPNTCHSNSLKDNKHLIQRLVDSQFSMPQSIYLSAHRTVKDLFCLNDNNTSMGLPLSGKIMIAAAVVWAMLLIGATSYGDTWKWRPANVIAECFNMKGLIQDFVDYDRENVSVQSPVDLDALNIIKVIGMMLIILGHSVAIVGNFGSDALKIVSTFRKDHLLTLSLAINQMVDTFFVLSGLLFSYIALKKFKTEIKSSNTLAPISKLASKLFFGRYLRLVPLYFIVFWFKRSVLIYLGSGPLWDPGFNQYTIFGACKREPWMTPLTPMSAYWPTGQQCLLAAWSLGAEIFFILLTTPLFIVLAKKPKLSMVILSAMGLASWALMYNSLFEMDTDILRSYNYFDSDMLQLMAIHSPIYTNPNYRLTGVLSGLVCGCLLYYYERNTRKWPIWFTKYAGKVAIASIIMCLCSYSTLPTVFEYDLLDYGILPDNIILHSVFIIRLVWILASCALSLCLVTEYQHVGAVRLFAGKFGRTMSKVNLAALLIHFDVLLIKHVYARSLTESFSKIKILDVFLLSYVYTLVLATIVHVLVESPISKMIVSILQGHKRDPPGKKEKQT